MCGQESNQLKLGTCSIRWAYVVACVSIFQLLFLTILAFMLAARQAKFILLYASKNRYESTGNKKVIHIKFLPDHKIILKFFFCFQSKYNKRIK